MKDFMVIVRTVKLYRCRSLTRQALTKSSLLSTDLSSLRRKRDWSQDARYLHDYDKDNDSDGIRPYGVH